MTRRVLSKERRLRKMLVVALGASELGQRISAAREEAGLSQSELARIVGLRHPQSISNYERGVSDPSRRRLEQIADATGKPLGYFIEETPSMPITQAADLLAHLVVVEERVEGLAGEVAQIRLAVADLASWLQQDSGASSANHPAGGRVSSGSRSAARRA